MIIELKKNGSTLTSRQAGKEALAAFRPILSDISSDETISIDFSGVITFTPSWGDEFLTPLEREFGDRLILLATDNLSVVETLKVLESTNSIKFRRR